MEIKSKFIEFYGEECPGCKNVRRLLDMAESERGIKFERFEVWHNKENDAFMEKCDGGRCNGIPMIYNTETNQVLCGEIDYNTLIDFIKE